MTLAQPTGELPRTARPEYITTIRNNPEELLGNTLLVEGRRRTYNPDTEETTIKNAEIALGTITDYDAETDTYTVEFEGEVNIETGEYPNETRIYEHGESGDADPLQIRIPAVKMRQKLKQGTGARPKNGAWWVDEPF